MNPFNSAIILDPSGENKIKEGYECVDTEVDLLLRDNERQKLWVRGENLCRWVVSLCRNRGLKETIDYQVLASPRDRLRRLAGEKVGELDAEIIWKVTAILDQDPQLSIAGLLSHLTSNDHWLEPISNKQAAEYLLYNVDARLELLVDIQRQQWVEECKDAALKQVYEKPLSARTEFARSWLRAGNNFAGLGVFPIRLDGEATKLVTEEWGKLLRQTHGKAIEELSVDNPNSRLIAETAYEYFSQHSESLTSRTLDRVGPLRGLNLSG
jgi:hypothetical protein